MPVLTPDYVPPRWLRNGHVQTVVGRYTRRISLPPYTRRRLELSDGDFLDLDEISQNHSRVAILLHGLESCSQAPYVRGQAKTLLAEGWDIIALNLRGCSGEHNRLLRSYHSGVTDDLHAVIDDLKQRRPQEPIALVGFSLGGNVVLRYLGERGALARESGVIVGAGVSVPCDLEGCAEKFAQPSNRIYMERFLKLLFRKVQHRQEHFPEALDYQAILASRNFHDFDGRFTAPAHGFASARDYWQSCSAKATAESIAVPTLLVNAEDDPFLTHRCHLLEEAADHCYLHAEMTNYGGHVAFISKGRKLPYHEDRIRTFFAKHSSA